jgi:aminopeptidase
MSDAHEAQKDRAELMRRLARVTVRVGANVRPGQEVVIEADDVQHAVLSRLIAEESYLAGASLVSVVYWDKQVKRSRLLHAPKESLSTAPDWWNRHMEECVEKEGAYINVYGDPYLGLFDDIDPGRLSLDRMPWTDAYLPLLTESRVNWTVVCGPTAGLAERALGAPDVDRLWDVLVPILRLDAEDTEDAWRQRLAELDRRAAALDRRRFSHIQFNGPGTDLRVGLLPTGKWSPSSFTTRSGARTIANLPTEEVQTTPDCRNVVGTVAATRPVPLAGGAVVEGLRLRFDAGRVTEVEARSNADAIRSLIETDAGASRLGELALVADDSPVASSGLVFGDVLLDENAACHIAVGQAYAQTVDGLPSDPDRQVEMGFNNSEVHQDLMIGGADVAVHGVDNEGHATPIMRDGAWVLD